MVSVRHAGLLGIAVVLTACAAPGPEGPSSPPDSISQPGLRDELLRMEAEDQSLRAELFGTGAGNLGPDDAPRLEASDAAHEKRLREIVAEHGWPTPGLVGEDGVDAAFLIVQHSSAAFQQEALGMIRDTVSAGDLHPEALALLTDRVLVGQGKPQQYGTQASVVDGRIVFDAMDDEAAVERRRAEIGLPPLAEYKKMLERAYGLTPRAPEPGD